MQRNDSNTKFAYEFDLEGDKPKEALTNYSSEDCKLDRIIV